jgi:arylsulfatase A-like enzyme
MTDEKTQLQHARARSPRPVVLFWIGTGVVVVGLLAWMGSYLREQRDPTRPIRLIDVVEPGDAAGYNVLLITLDTTRADHLSAYGYEKLATPTINSLLDHGVRFDHAVTSVPVTLPAHATILTGLDPYRHGVRNNGNYRLPMEQTTLAEVLREYGYETAAFVASFVLDARFGLDQGFDVYDFEVSDEGRRGPQSLTSERGAHHITTAAAQWLDARSESAVERPFFLWVHYYDPHAPYESPLEDARRSGRRSRMAAYDAEIAFVDLELRRLLQAVEEHDFASRTLIVLVSDHGESLGDHGEEEHGGFLYEPPMRVALILSCPTLVDRSYRVDDRVVGTVDIVPTVLELLGIPLPTSFDGRSLLVAEADPNRAVYMETRHTQENLGCAPLFGLRRLHDKFILAPRPEYYDLQQDPRESDNRYDPADEKIAALERQLGEIMDGWPEHTDAARTMSADEIRRLAALGYVELSDDDDAVETLPDPKDRVPKLGELAIARDLMSRRMYAAALQKLQALTRETQGAEEPMFMLADAYVLLDQRPEAVRVLSEFAAEYPSASALVRLAAELLVLERYAAMEKALQAAEAIEPLCGMIHVLRGDRHFRQQHYEQAAQEYEAALELDEQRLGPKVADKLRQTRRLAGRGG